ncbi:GNAT family N-acetyltransferase [Amycolatopsis sp. WQ 127309]|uniref:GNAT family N-acetyltransferase n=1 Tax=Amycolatopsis sp. WQ 127309 TaxID=2932773 RepID=UPI001FF6E260|nr:GNAT family N-acetyltransferase [Amycolatopsis sp. WQ 127309]UOZ02807.1 GNAT family N-acetyltransferase [Amycolatopsis sp. WQ 127309]
MSSEVGDAERALHRRMGLACAAATAAGLPGRFRVWEDGGLLAVLATDPALGFLSTVSGVTPETLPALDVLLAGWEPTVLTTGDEVPEGLVRAEDRLLAVRRLGEPPEADPGVTEGDDVVDVLLAGYEVTGVVAAFVAAEHRVPAMRRFLLVEGGTPIAAAGMTVHGDVAVLGGAATLPAHRGRGAQSRLLRHRLRVAADAGCVLAVATARAGSVSAANLGRAGFRRYRRSAWTKP